MSAEPIKTAYMDASASEYDKIRFTTPQGNHFDLRENEQLERCLVAVGRESNVVEVGCGTGRFLAKVASYCNHVTGIDPSEDMLAEARKKVTVKYPFELRQGEGANIPLEDSSIDFVYSIRTLNQVESEEYAYRMIRELFRVCRPGGKCLLEILNRKSLNRQKKAVRLTVGEVMDFVSKQNMGTVLRVSGILFFTQTVLDKTPAVLLPLYSLFDRVFSKFFPKYCSRCYILMQKTES